MVELEITRLSEVQSTDVEWLWYPYIPFGKLTIIQGDPGSGKTRLMQRCKQGAGEFFRPLSANEERQI